MTRFPSRSGFALAALIGTSVATGVSTPARAAGARTVELVERVSEDPCDRARAFEIGDDGAAAQHARRLCRLQQFENRLAAERRQEVAAELQARDARLATWLDAKMPTRVVRPLAIEGFGGTGILTYGLLASWTVLRRLELSARIGWRKMTCASEFSSSGADCTRQGMGLGTRFFFTERDFGPFIGGGFTVTNSHLQVQTSTPETGFMLLKGDGRAHSLSASGGLQLAVKGLRLSLEYVYEWLYYTGANVVDANNKMLRNETLRVIWRDSLTQDQHGVRFQAGYAF